MCGASEIYYVVPSGFSRFSALFRGVYPIKIDAALIKAKDQVVAAEEAKAAAKAAEEAKAAEDAAEAAKAAEETTNSFTPLEEAVEPTPVASSQQKKNKKK